MNRIVLISRAEIQKLEETAEFWESKYLKKSKQVDAALAGIKTQHEKILKLERRVEDLEAFIEETELKLGETRQALELERKARRAAEEIKLKALSERETAAEMATFYKTELQRVQNEGSV